MWQQTKIALPSFQRGFHIITPFVVDALKEIEPITIGLLNLFINHTSASIAINEDADPSVRKDFESHFNNLIPENMNYYQHTSEGPDDMPAHIKSAIIGCSLSIPITNGKLNLGTWQGIYLCEHRNHGGSRKIILTLQGKN
ncbi:MAG: hypothetical protein CMG08_02170 [Candidatus Marinimicrobia bacterium]|nr:hypothetical protein [Candidatus Neomarinimicrobiota bacterium]